MNRAGKDKAIIQAVARNVRCARKELMLSQEELADSAGVDRTYISQVERSRRNITVSVLARIARALKVAPGALLDGAVGAPKRAAPRTRAKR